MLAFGYMSRNYRCFSKLLSESKLKTFAPLPEDEIDLKSFIIDACPSLLVLNAVRVVGT